MAPSRCGGGEGDYRPGIPLVVIVPLATGQQIDYSYYGHYYGADVDGRCFVHEQPQEQVAHENQYADCAEHTAHEGFEPFDIDFFLLLGRHGVVSCNELGESPDEKSEQDEEG